MTVMPDWAILKILSGHLDLQHLIVFKSNQFLLQNHPRKKCTQCVYNVENHFWRNFIVLERIMVWLMSKHQKMRVKHLFAKSKKKKGEIPYLQCPDFFFF